MAANVSLPGNTVSVSAGASLTTVSTALFSLKVSLIGGLSLTGNGGAVVPTVPYYLLLANGTDFLLLVDGSSLLQLA